MAAPGRIEDPNWHRSRELPQECEWKQGESARGKKTFLRRQEGGRSWRLPLVGEAVVRFAVPEKVLTRPAFSWKPRPPGSGVFQWRRFPTCAREAEQKEILEARIRVEPTNSCRPLPYYLATAPRVCRRYSMNTTSRRARSSASALPAFAQIGPHATRRPRSNPTPEEICILGPDRTT